MYEVSYRSRFSPERTIVTFDSEDAANEFAVALKTSTFVLEVASIMVYQTFDSARAARGGCTFWEVANALGTSVHHLEVWLGSGDVEVDDLLSSDEWRELVEGWGVGGCH